MSNQSVDVFFSKVLLFLHQAQNFDNLMSSGNVAKFSNKEILD